jgi:hypothetical protein
MVQGLQIPFDRVTYRDGQLLTALDMQDDQAINSRMWELHTRYLHETWSIAIGFQVSGNPGDSVVQVGPGYAVDRQGRPLISSQTVQVPLPLIVGPDYRILVIGYQGDAAFRDQVGLDNLCVGPRLATRQESPTFNWKLPDDVRLGIDVPLIAVNVSNGTIITTDSRSRRFVQKLLRPYIASGATDQGSTQWNPIPGAAPEGFTLFQTPIDTSDGAFNDTPFYFPELHMWNQAPQSIYGVTNLSPNSDFADYGGPLTFLTNPTSTSFDFNLVLPTSANNTLDPNNAQWTVSWVGIEVAQCGPQFHLILGFILNFRRLFPQFPEIFL